jgi:SAM-dependent methyltransferase
MVVHVDTEQQWLKSLQAARAWLSSPVGQLLLVEEHRLLEQELGRYFGGYLVHYGVQAEQPPQAPQVLRNVRLGPLQNSSDILCEEQAWPLCEHAADVVVVQHGLDFSRSPHALLREAAQSVRPGGHLLVVGLNPWSSWGLRSVFSRSALGDARCISANRVLDWLNLLGFALEKRRFGCYRPPLASAAWQARLAWLERFGGSWQAPAGGFYILVARKMVVGLRPVRPSRREALGKLVPMPVAKISRRHSKP